MIGRPEREDGASSGGSSSNPAQTFSKRGFRSRNGRLSNVVVIEVNKNNLSKTWPYLRSCIYNASFIAIDLVRSYPSQYCVFAKFLA
ncbi:unnamed protein product [Gongylonema pulchrum]|uniref:Uncharacterized protein n=1 Tax=Gongylonema pulchrum TaxID=637853 RepID=A0A183EPK7_9BILA|nr:unnamed protein product [Gongylonema pulchrum]